jgi:hypothetical protein
LRSGFTSCFSVSCNGSGRDRAGGLAFLWNDQVSLSILSYSLNHILASVADGKGGDFWSISGIYGYPEENYKKKTWGLIKHLASMVSSKWLCLGDFNDILNGEEKLGGAARSQNQFRLGRETLNDCGLIDMGFEGYPFTWSNNRGEEENIQCRLDRALGSEDFLNRFSPTKVVHLPRFGSDHAALLVLLEAHDYGVKKKRIHLFRFEEVWTKDNRCEELIARSWRSTGGNCISKLSSIQSLDADFEDYQIGNIRKEIKSIESKLRDLPSWSANKEEIDNVRELEGRHSDLLQIEESIWRQRSRAIWLREGDKNTKFFHGKATQRKKVNEIKKIKDASGTW